MNEYLLQGSLTICKPNGCTEVIPGDSFVHEEGGDHSASFLFINHEHEIELVFSTEGNRLSYWEISTNGDLKVSDDLIVPPVYFNYVPEDHI